MYTSQREKMVLFYSKNRIYYPYNKMNKEVTYLVNAVDDDKTRYYDNE